MGTLRLSAPRNQMRKVQRTARREGPAESTTGVAAVKSAGEARSSCNKTVAAGAASTIATVCTAGAVLVSAGFCCGKTHDFIVAQQGHSALCATGAVLMAQACTGPWSGAKSNATRRSRPVVSRRDMLLL